MDEVTERSVDATGTVFTIKTKDPKTGKTIIKEFEVEPEEKKEQPDTGAEKISHVSYQQPGYMPASDQPRGYSSVNIIRQQRMAAHGQDQVQPQQNRCVPAQPNPAPRELPTSGIYAATIPRAVEDSRQSKGKSSTRQSSRSSGPLPPLPRMSIPKSRGRGRKR